MNKSDSTQLHNWFLAHQRRLPWRENRDPYRIWISETMLQQTTTTAVLGYYERFLTQFDTLHKLAHSSIEDVYKLWAGLGYYSRARNLHKAAQLLAKMSEFPKSYTELLKFPGFGPYTARAVSSLAFSEQVGVLDGNVIRVLSRKENLALEWWRPKIRAQMQAQIDQFVQFGQSEVLNQALMELGSQICVPKNPHCKICPWLKTCKSFKAKTVALRPLKKPRRKSEIWIWTPKIQVKNDSVFLQKNDYAPFLRGAWILPGKVKSSKNRPQRYDFRHSITHHDIFVQLESKAAIINSRTPVSKKERKESEKWVNIQQLSSVATSSLIKKALEHAKCTSL